jgi:hypothetical protein
MEKQEGVYQGNKYKFSSPITIVDQFNEWISVGIRPSFGTYSKFFPLYWNNKFKNKALYGMGFDEMKIFFTSLDSNQLFLNFEKKYGGGFLLGFTSDFERMFPNVVSQIYKNIIKINENLGDIVAKDLDKDIDGEVILNETKKYVSPVAENLQFAEGVNVRKNKSFIIPVLLIVAGLYILLRSIVRIVTGFTPYYMSYSLLIVSIFLIIVGIFFLKRIKRSLTISH